MDIKAYEVSRVKALLQTLALDMADFKAVLAQVESKAVRADLGDRFRSMCLQHISK